MTDLLTCPWCQKAPDVYDGAIVCDTGKIAECVTRGCPNMHHPMRLDEWNRRAPVRVDDAMVERALIAQRDALKIMPGRDSIDYSAAMRAALEAAMNKDTK